MNVVNEKNKCAVYGKGKRKMGKKYITYQIRYIDIT
jgi:hypothetical protein